MAEARLHPRAGWYASRRDTSTAILFLLPLFVLVVALIIYPFYRAIWLSFTDKLVGYPERFVGFKNYLYLLNEDTFRSRNPQQPDLHRRLGRAEDPQRLGDGAGAE